MVLQKIIYTLDCSCCMTHVQHEHTNRRRWLQQHGQLQLSEDSFPQLEKPRAGNEDRTRLKAVIDQRLLVAIYSAEPLCVKVTEGNSILTQHPLRQLVSITLLQCM